MTDNQTSFDDYDDYAKRPVPASELEEVPEDDFAKRPVAPADNAEAPSAPAYTPATLSDAANTTFRQTAPAAPAHNPAPAPRKWLLPVIAVCAVAVVALAAIALKLKPENDADKHVSYDRSSSASSAVNLPGMVADDAAMESMEVEWPATDDAEPTEEATTTTVSYTGFVSGDFIITPTSDSTCSILIYQGNATDLIIPATLSGYQVTRIEDLAFAGRTALRSIVVPEGITSIGNDVCLMCPNLTSITLPASVESIGNYSFTAYPSLQVIYVTEGSYAHRFCAYYQVPYEFTNADAEEPEVVAAPREMLEWGVSVGDYSITTYSNGTCDIIGYNGNAAQLTIPETIDGYRVTSIGYSAFYYCASLTSVIIPDSVTSIGERAFYYCQSLASIFIPDSVTHIGLEAFCTCYALESVTFPDNLVSIGSNAFSGCHSLTNVTLPDSLSSIGQYAFSSCSSLTSIVIPNSITAIENGTFSRCTSLADIVLPSSITSIGDNAFSHCSSLTSILLPASVTSIGYNAFSECHSLLSIIIPNGVTRINGGAFSDCTNLVTISIPDSVYNIGYSTFSGCPILIFIVPENSYAHQYCVENNLPYVLQ